MNNNYEVVYVDEVNLEQAIDFIDVEAMAQHIYFGPQAEIMERLNNFNQRYQAGLSVTKTFRWSPGTYDKVAEMMMRKVGLRRRASGMWNYLSREDYWWRIGREQIQADLREMDQMITRLRYDRVTWLDDPAVLIERKELFKNYICEKFEQFLDITSSTDRITVLNVLLEGNEAATTQSLKLTINIVLSPGEVQVYNVTSDPEPTHIQNLPVDMDVLLKIEIYPLQEMVRHTDYNRPSFNVNTYGRAESYDDRGPLRFPYVSSTRRQWNQPDGWGTICYGDDSTDINAALRRFELPAYSLLLMNWMNRYTQNTNPYNNIKMLYHGEPSWLTDAYRTIFGTNSWDNCNYRPSGEEDYCDTNECALRHTCEIYQAAHPEPVTPEQAEQLTLQWATRMGGVGANTQTNPTFSGVPPVDPMSTPVTDQDLVTDEDGGELSDQDGENRDPQGRIRRNSEEIVEEVRQTLEEAQINLAMDAEEEHGGNYERFLDQENPEPNNLEEE